MILHIDKTHPIFDSEAYQKDIVPFNLMEIIRQSPILLDSDGESFIVGMTAPKYPVWVWTADNITEDTLDKLSVYFYEKFKDGNSVRFVAKPVVASLLSKNFIINRCASAQCINMESYICTDLIPAKSISAAIEKPSDTDLGEIAACMNSFMEDCFGKGLSDEENIHEAERIINNPKSFVIKQNGKVASMACSARESEKHTAINHVYTCPEYRNRGFASAVVAHICKLILDEGKIPALYTDLSNPSSNKAYKNIGFKECGKVDDITLKWGDTNA